MPILAITGLPGHGKTLYALWRIKQEAEKEGRPVFHNGIPDLNITGWQTCDVQDWQKLPPNSIIVVDEAQKVFPVRGRDKPPAFIEDLATHRHLGVDFVVITQDPMLIDSFVRRLVDRHFHVVRKFGTHFATVYESVTGCRDNVSKSRKDLIRHEWRYPKEVFGWYKSAELHTVKRRLPARFWLLVALPLIFIALATTLWFRVQPEAHAARVGAAAGLDPGQAGQATGGQAQGQGAGQGGQGVLTVGQYLQAHMPRVPDLPHTAPVYDEVTKPVRAPYPAACISSKARCSCYTQQGTRLTTSDDACRRFARDGFFVNWDTANGQREPQPAPAAAAPSAHQVAQQGPTFVVVPAPPAPVSAGPSPPEAVGRAIRLARPPAG